MIRLKIDKIEVQVEKGTTVLGAARKAGIEIPVMCYYEGVEHFSSCMICMVKERDTARLIPACSVKAAPGMDLITTDKEILEARQTALELLLSEHVGDCEAPCRIACPAHMDIPRMNRLLAKGEFEKALQVVKKAIALPAVLGRICTAPCEGACHRKSIDEPVAICLLKRFAADYNLKKIDSYLPPVERDSGFKVAIIGAGAAGLSAAYFLQQQGHHCTIFEKEKLPGGEIRENVPEEQLPWKIYDQEIELIRLLGVLIQTETLIDETAFTRMLIDFDAIVIACGNVENDMTQWGVEISGKKVNVDKKSFQTNIDKVFAIGNVINPTKLAIRVVAQGKEVAFSVQQFLKGEKVTGEPEIFNSRFGKLFPAEFGEYLKESVPYKQIQLSQGISEGFTPEEVKQEAARCLHCDCRDAVDCKLRKYAEEYNASQKRFPNVDRKKIRKIIQHDQVIYEPAKCIKCGICVRLTRRHQEKFGFTFIGRGFDVEIGVPFNEELKYALTDKVNEVAKACPTGAISLKLI